MSVPTFRDFARASQGGDTVQAGSILSASEATGQMAASYFNSKLEL